MPLHRIVRVCVMITAGFWSGALAQISYTAQTRNISFVASWMPFGKGGQGGYVNYSQSAPDFSVFNGDIPNVSQVSSLLPDRFTLQGTCTALHYGLGPGVSDADSNSDITFTLSDQTVLDLSGSIVHPDSPGDASASIVLIGSDGVTRYSFDGFGTPSTTVSLPAGSYHFVFRTSASDGSNSSPSVTYEVAVTATQCSTFQPTYPGLNGPVRALTSWTPGGVGPQLPHLVAGGAFTWNDGQGSQDYIAWWDGTAWSNFGWGTDGPVNAMTTWDPDGPGPLPGQLIIGGEFPDVGADSTGGITVNYIARWDGVAWQPLGAGADGPVDALTTWDPDGDGPLPVVLVAAGRFTHIGGVWTGGVAYWDGAAWHSFGWGINGPGMALAVWDPDGPGPQTPQLIVGGNFTHAGAASTGQIDAGGIARWDGSAWRAMGNIYARSFAVVNAQGNSPRLYAGGGEYSGGSVKHWDGASWQDDDFVFSVPTGYGSSYLTYGIVSNMMEWDPDGPGPLPSSLYVSGRYSYYVPPCGKDCGDRNATVMVIARHDETAWTVINQSHDAYVGMVQSILPFDPDSSGPAHSGLIAGGSADSVVLALQSYSYPLLDQVPTSLTVYARGTASFSVHCPDTTVSYAWYRYQPSYGSVLEDYQPLADGPTLTGSVITGSSTGTLTIAHASPAHLAWPSVIVSDVTSYRCVITDLCGRTHAVEVALNVLPGSCTADYNHDGDAGTDQDIEAFFACLAGSCCPTCGDADFNGDGDVGTDADIDSFFRVLGGGPC